MRYDVRQTTHYRYADPVTAVHQVLRLKPADRTSDPVVQHVLAPRLSFSTKPTEISEHTDVFGNTTTLVRYSGAHRELRIDSRFSVDVDASRLPDPEMTPHLAAIGEGVRGSLSLAGDAPAHFRAASRVVRLDPKIAAWAREDLAPDRPVLAAALAVARRLKAEFTYDPEATDVATPPSTAFQLRRGVCQDFAHVLVCGLRGNDVPACYVSGYLRTRPPEGQARLVGADATHAWVAVWCGGDMGWVGVDPTNGVLAAEDHIVLALGRDYADVSPVAGIMHASGASELSVSVDVAAAE